MMISLLLSAAFIASATGLVKETLPKGSDRPVKKLLKKYREQAPIEIKLRKVSRKAVKDKAEVSSGVLQFKKDRLRLELDGENSALTVIDGRYIWLENQIESFDGKSKQIQVTKMKLSPERIGSPILALLFGKSSDLKEFRFVKSQKEEAKTTFTYHSISEAAQYQELNIAINEKEGRIVQLSFLDHLENQEVYTFGVTRFKTKLDKNTFRYSPPEGADVTEI